MNTFSKSTLAAIFKRKARAAVGTRLFDEMDQRDQSRLVAELEFDVSEEPVLAIDEAGRFILALTTHNLYWREEDSRVMSVALSNISWQSPIRTGEKRSWTQLSVETFGGAEFVVTAEAGSAYFALWSVLLYISRRNRKFKETEHSANR